MICSSLYWLFLIVLLPFLSQQNSPFVTSSFWGSGHGGKIVLGVPSASGHIYGTGQVSWMNNLFDNVNIYLQPTYYRYNRFVNCDMQVQAYNNLFLNNQWIVLAPYPVSAGNWLFKDNLFDLANFYQDTDEPLDVDNNAYWPLSRRDLALESWEQFWWSGNRAQLTNTVPGSGTHEMTLVDAPPYQTGPLGDYYLPENTPLYQAGSRTAAEAGLTNYTSFVNQTKDAADQPVNIGLHYVAARTNGLPLDSDGDGVPDYVEGEHGTDPNNPMTDGVTNDAYNVVYDDIDLDGDGLTGRAERILGTNPLVQDNPLKLTPVITGEEPYILTYSMPLNVDVNSNLCQLTLLDNGCPAGGYDFVRQTNGTYLVECNTTFATNGSHILQVELFMPGSRLPLNDDGTKPVQPVLSVAGPTRIENVNNLIQIASDETSFGSQVWYHGTLAVQSADYEIDIYDTNSVLLKTITGHTDNGTLDVVWDLTTNTNQPPRNDDEFDALVYITPTEAANFSRSYFDANASPSSQPARVWKFKRGGCGDLFTLAYGWNPESYLYHIYRSNMIRDAVENIVFNPGLDNQYWPTFLNCYDCDPFFMGSTNDQETLLNDLANGSVGNFFFDGHGSEISIGSATNHDTEPELSFLSAQKVKEKLRNNITYKGQKYGHPYRFVILNACDCGMFNDWAYAFGIETGTYTSAWIQQQGYDPQAMVAWTGDIYEPGGDPMDIGFSTYGEHLADLFDLWMSGTPLYECVTVATEPDPANWPFDHPLDRNWKIFGAIDLTR